MCWRLVRKRLANAVDLVVVAAAREGLELCFQVCQPRRIRWEQHLTALELSELDCHAGLFVILRFDRDDGRPRQLDFLNERSTESSIFDQDRACLMFLACSVTRAFS